MKKEKKISRIYTTKLPPKKKKSKTFFPISLSKNGEISKNGETLNPKLGHRSQKFCFVFVLNKISSSALALLWHQSMGFFHS